MLPIFGDKSLFVMGGETDCNMYYETTVCMIYNVCYEIILWNNKAITFLEVVHMLSLTKGLEWQRKEKNVMIFLKNELCKQEMGIPVD